MRRWISGWGCRRPTPPIEGGDLTAGLRGAAPCRAAGRAVLPAAVLLGAGLLVGCATEQAVAPQERPAVDAVLARLPARAAGFDRGVVQDVAPGDPGAGKVVEYVTPRRVAVAYVFLYDLGRPAIAQAELPPEAERAFSEATALPSDRTGRQLSVASRTPLPVPGGDLSCAALEGSFGRTRVERQVCVGVVSGRFLRVQVTMPAGGGRAAPADARAFAAEVAGAARGG